MKHAFFRFGIALALFSALPASANAQFGRLGDAVKKKAKEAAGQVIGKEDPKKDEQNKPQQNQQEPNANQRTTNSAPVQINITTLVLDNFAKGLNAESAKRTAYFKNQKCSQSATQSTEWMQVMAAHGNAMGKQVRDDMTDAQKIAALMQAGEDLQKKQTAFVTKKCGPVIESPQASALDSLGAATSGLTANQYGSLKERITAYCAAVAHGSDTPSDHNLVFTDEEIAVLKPRCAALAAKLKQLN